MNAGFRFTGLSRPCTKCTVRAVLFLVLLALVTSGDAWATVRCVDVNSTNPAPPYTSWATAARVIQDAVDAAELADEVIVADGTYAAGGKAVYGTMTNRVAVDKPLALRSVNGPEATIIEGCQVPGSTNGDSAIRCVFLATGASLSGFTLANGGRGLPGICFARGAEAACGVNQQTLWFQTAQWWEIQPTVEVAGPSSAR